MATRPQPALKTAEAGKVRWDDPPNQILRRPAIPITARWRRAWYALLTVLRALDSRLEEYYRTCEQAGHKSFTAEPEVIPLQANELLRLPSLNQVGRIEVRNGTLWLTETPAKGDVILHVGQCVSLTKDSHPVIQALGKATVLFWR